MAPLPAADDAAAGDDQLYETGPAVRWPALVGTLLCLAGIGVATYLTITHYDTGVTLACPDTGVINCAKVTSSSYSKVFGIPVAVLGLAFFVSMLPLQLPAAWRSTNPLIRRVRVGSVVVGIGFVMWLLYAELVKIQNICLYCTSVHVITFLLLITTVVGTISTTVLPEE
jgi:uncharacterized membrane protein